MPASHERVTLSCPVSPFDVSVVICAYTLEREAELVAAIESILNQKDPVGELIVVIDHNDELLAWGKGRYPALQVVPNSGAQGLSGARNTGVACSSGAVVAFLDDDAQATPNWVRELTAAYSVGRVLGAGGWIEPAWASGRPRWWPPEFDWVVGCSYTGLPTDRAYVRNMIGANMSFRRDVLKAAGGFHGYLGRVGAGATGGEETELCIRARALFPKAEIVFEPRAHVRHRVGPGRCTWRYFMKRCWGEGKSKARVGSLASHSAALATERDYVVKTLARGFLAAVLRGHWRRALTILAGLAVTTAGYAHAIVTERLRPRTGPTVVQPDHLHGELSGNDYQPPLGRSLPPTMESTAPKDRAN
jgi:glycosyltransferase involved in cell wall biosynthesis